ncbi:MAG: holo-ACP synthase [Gammaproteobacteria bacterium]|jgi:holo-[acyl-carrier protein] synthase|nr:holo-ACP synthase [Gammaproteobacteria bacterium]
MIFGIGTDIVEIQRMQDLLDKYGVKAAQKILSETELAEFEQATNQAAFIAKRFAAKEATAKAFGTGFRDGLNLGHIAVKNNEAGKPELYFTERAGALLLELGIVACFLSLSDEQHYAIAHVVMEKKV